jgi:hypothetical protein
MAIDPSIVLRLQQPQAANPINKMAQIMQVRGMQDEQSMRQMQADQIRRGIEQENALNEAYRGAVGPDGAVDRNRLFSVLAERGLGAKLPGIQKQFLEADEAQAKLGKTKAETGKIDFDMGIKRGEHVASVLSTAQDQASYDLARQQLAQSFGPQVVANMPPQFDPNAVQAMVAQGMTIVQRLTDERARQQQAETNRHNKASEGLTARGQDITVRGQDMVNQRAVDRLEFDRGNAVTEAGGPTQAALAKRLGKAPAGYRWREDGTMEAVPGGPADIKAGEAGAKRARQIEGAIGQATRVISKVDEALGKVGYTTAGVGSVMSKIPGTDARDLQSALETIKANLGFAELQAMRDASPTGGALGAIAVQELIALQSTVASLDQAQSPDQLKKSLDQIKTHYGNWRKTLQDGNAPPPPPKPGGAAPKPIASDAEYNALPSGAEFIAPDGSRRRKP